MRMAFMGSKAMGLAILRQLHELASDHLVGAILYDNSADQRSSLRELKAFAEATGIEYTIARSRECTKDQLRRIAPDIVIASGWYLLLDNEAITLPKYGIVGLHNSLLPAYRGGSRLVWAIMNAERTVGATFFRMTVGVDNGPVLATFPVDVGDDDTIADVLGRLEAKILAQLPVVWSNLINGTVRWVEQDHSKATFCALRTPDDGRIDWRWPARRVHDFVRAQTLPYPCAFTFVDGASVKIVRTERAQEKWLATPGQVIATGMKPLVACGDGTTIRIVEVLSDGKPRSASEVLRSTKIRMSS